MYLHRTKIILCQYQTPAPAIEKSENIETTCSIVIFGTLVLYYINTLYVYSQLNRKNKEMPTHLPGKTDRLKVRNSIIMKIYILNTN